MHRSQAQLVLDVMFEILSRCHARDRVPQDREELMEFARDQLRKCGVNVVPMGISHAVLREPTDVGHNNLSDGVRANGR